MDESNATCGKRLESIGLENTEANRQAYRELLVTTPGLGQYISGGCRGVPRPPPPTPPRRSYPRPTAAAPRARPRLLTLPPSRARRRHPV